jgi:competence protein ComEC
MKPYLDDRDGVGGVARQRRSRLHALRLVVAVAAAVVLAALAASGCGGATAPAATPAPSDASAPATPAPSGAPVPSASPSSSSPVASPSPSVDAAAATRIVFVDVGQGDAAVLRSGSWTGLIDGGPAAAAPAVDAALTKLGVRRLDTVVVSHLHADHTGGLPSVIAEYRPRRLLVAGRVTGGLASALRRAGTAVVQVRRGNRLRCGAARATVLSPGSLSGDPNADSIVLLLETAGRRVLFTGDCTGPNEAAVGAVLARGPPLDVLKVAHHGSRYSTLAGFLRGARPRVAVVSVGRNSYGHPSNAAVQRLRRVGSRVYSTQGNGSVSLIIERSGAVKWGFARASAPLTRGVSGGASTGASIAGAAAGSASRAAGSAGPTAGDPTVCITASGECYHRDGCRYLSSSRIAISLSRARAAGYRPCGVCDPPR